MGKVILIIELILEEVVRVDFLVFVKDCLLKDVIVYYYEWMMHINYGYVSITFLYVKALLLLLYVNKLLSINPSITISYIK